VFWRAVEDYRQLFPTAAPPNASPQQPLRTLVPRQSSDIGAASPPPSAPVDGPTPAVLSHNALNVPLPGSISPDATPAGPGGGVTAVAMTVPRTPEPPQAPALSLPLGTVVAASAQGTGGGGGGGSMPPSPHKGAAGRGLQTYPSTSALGGAAAVQTGPGPAHALRSRPSVAAASVTHSVVGVVTMAHLSAADALHSTFIVAGAPLQVNVSHRNRSQISATLKRLQSRLRPNEAAGPLATIDSPGAPPPRTSTGLTVPGPAVGNGPSVAVHAGNASSLAVSLPLSPGGGSAAAGGRSAPNSARFLEVKGSAGAGEADAAGVAGAGSAPPVSGAASDFELAVRLFDAAQSEVVALVEADGFARYLQTKAGRLRMEMLATPV
jgi:hypothetical protein